MSNIRTTSGDARLINRKRHARDIQRAARYRFDDLLDLDYLVERDGFVRGWRCA